jgi:hypothetical protein
MFYFECTENFKNFIFVKKVLEFQILTNFVGYFGTRKLKSSGSRYILGQIKEPHI